MNQSRNNNIIKRVQISMPGNTLDPLLMTETVGREIIDNVYEKLYQFEGSELVMGLADKVSIEDARVYRMQLKKNIVFHDGSLLNSQVVKESLVRMLNYSNRARALFNGIISEDTIICNSEDEIEFILKRPDPDFLTYFALQEASIISPALLKCPELMKKKAVGTGPFILDEYNEQQQIITLRKHNIYWGGEVSIDKVEIIVESDNEKQKELFIKGDADILEVQTSQISDLSDVPNIVFNNFPSLDIVSFVFNLRNPKFMCHDLRKAIKYCFDYDRFLKNGRTGMGFRIASAVPKGLSAYSELVEPYNTDIDLAKYHYTRAKQSVDIPKNISILNILGLEDAEIACRKLCEGLELLGIEATIERLPFDEFCEKQDGGDFEISFLSWAPDSVSSYGFIYDFYHSAGQIAQMLGLSDKCLDDRIVQAKEICDKSVRNKELINIQKYAESFDAYMWLCQEENLKVHRNTIKNVNHNILDGDYNYKYLRIEKSL